MIAKNIKGKSFGGCVRYVLSKEHRLLAAEGVFAQNAESIIRSFNIQRRGRDEIKQPVGHIPLSFSPKDRPRMTDEFMLRLAEEYMKEMGVNNTQYIIVRHLDTAHDHLHIVYNRIDNDLKLISANNDYRRNIAACKKLKERHGLTFGEGKEQVNRPRLSNPDKTKYEIHDAIKAVLPKCNDYIMLEFYLSQVGIKTHLKYRRGTNLVEGVSFEKDGLKFKGSQIDRKFSHANLSAIFDSNERAVLTAFAHSVSSSRSAIDTVTDTATDIMTDVISAAGSILAPVSGPPQDDNYDPYIANLKRKKKRAMKM